MIHDHQHHHHQEIITEIEPDMPTVELDMIIEEIDEDHTGRVTFERNYTDDDDISLMVECLSCHYLTKTTL